MNTIREFHVLRISKDDIVLFTTSFRKVLISGLFRIGCEVLCLSVCVDMWATAELLNFITGKVNFFKMEGHYYYLSGLLHVVRRAGQTVFTELLKEGGVNDCNLRNEG